MQVIPDSSSPGIAVLKALGAREHVRKLLLVCGQAVENAAVLSARAKGGRRFWADVASSVSHQPTLDGGIVVGASHRVAGFKQTGGRISAPGMGPGSLGRKALTIPLGIAREKRWDTDQAEASGYSLFRNKDILFGRKAGKAKKASAKAIPLFLLRKSVFQKPDPWFPEGESLQRAIDKGVRLYQQRSGGIP